MARADWRLQGLAGVAWGSDGGFKSKQFIRKAVLIIIGYRETIYWQALFAPALGSKEGKG
jgi:hypothetical protein